MYGHLYPSADSIFCFKKLSSARFVKYLPQYRNFYRCARHAFRQLTILTVQKNTALSVAE